MKYSDSNKPLVCMQTQSTCYKGTSTMKPLGVLWHSTGANNPTLKRYVQPSDVRPAEDTYSKEEWLSILGKNQYNNDWNHIERQAGLNAWIGKLADGTVTSIQTMPWNYGPWGCGKGSKGSCNSGWMQFEICEDDLNNKSYFEAVYNEACELTAYYCKMYDLNPTGTVSFNGVTVPVILDHVSSYRLGLGSNHGDIEHWLKKYGKTLDNVREDVKKLMQAAEPTVVKTYEVVTDLPTYGSAEDAKAKKNQKGTYKPGTYYIFSKYSNGYDGMFNITKDSTGKSSGSWINPVENIKKTPADTPKAVYDLEYPEKHIIIDTQIGSAFDKEGCTKAIVAIKKNNPSFDVEIAKAFFTLAPKYQIDPMRAISQSILETGWFKFVGSSVKPEQHNYCGLGATGGGVAGAAFDTIQDGVRAQLQHLYAYGCKDALPADEEVIDPRFKYVTRGIAPYWEQLAGRWAYPGFDGDDPVKAVQNGTTYGQKIDKIFNQLQQTSVSSADVATYFQTEQDKTTPTPTPVDPEEKLDVKKVSFVLELLKNVLKFILSWFKK